MSKILAQGMITLTQLYEGAQVILTPAAVLIPCDSNETPKPNAYINAFTNVKVFLGTMDITSGITLGELEYSDSTVRASKSGTKVSITTITTRTGYVDIPVSATIDGETIDLGKHRFSFVKQIDGQTGQPGIQGDPGFSYTLNIKGGTRGIAYAANGTNPEPNASSQFSVELLKNGIKVSNPASISWTCGGNLSGSSSAATFTPTIKSMYTSESSYVKVSVKEFAASLAVEETIPIICTKHADGLDWINEWNNQYVQIGTEKIITPKIFAGTKNSANELTGVAIGRDVLGGSPNKVIGIVGYKENTPVFSLDQDANFFVSSSGSPGDIKNGTNNAKGIYFDGNNLYVSGKVKISGGSTIGENNTLVEDVINNSNLGAQANNKLDNLSIGGRNLVKGTAEPFVVTHTELNKQTSKGLPLSSYLQNNKNIIRNKYITFSIDVKTTNLVYGTTNPWVGFELYVQGNTRQWLGIGGTRIKAGTSDGFVRYVHTEKVNDMDITGLSVQTVARDFTGTVELVRWQIEIGSKATDWSPAPEDITANIDTAKNEAINSANNTLTTTIANYYTKEQTNSQIDIAKEAINLGVSQTYETKTDTTTKINNAVNGIKIGGTNLITKKSGFVYGYINSQNGSLNNTNSLNSNQDFYTSDYFLLKTGESVCLASYPKSTVNSSIQAAVYIHVYNLSKVWQKSISHNTNTANATANKIYTATEDCYIRFCSRGFNDYNHMAEYATKPSQWSPAPEDTATDIATAKTEAINTASGDATNKVNSAKNELNTAIGKKANSADVYTKSEVYTKVQTDSAIKVAKDEINLGVSQTYETKSSVETKVNSAKNELNTKIDGIQIGGRNLFLNSGFTKGMNHWYTHSCSNVQAIADSSALSGYAAKFTSTGTEGGLFQRKSGDANNTTKYQNGSVMTVSGYVKSSVAGKVLRPNFERGGTNTLKNITCTNADTWYYFTHTCKITTNDFSTVTFYGDSGADYYLKDLMLEYGNKASTWTLAPEDIDTAIGEKANSADVYTKSEVYTKTETNSQINIAKEEINLGVSNTYETKTNVETKVNNAVNNLQIGGRNLQRNTEFKNDLSHWLVGTGYSRNTSKKFDGSNTVYFTRTGLAADNVTYLFSENTAIQIEVGQTVTASANFFTDNVSSIDGGKAFIGIWFYDAGGSSIASSRTTIPFVNGKWVKCSHTATAPANAVYGAIVIGTNRNGSYYIGKPMFEKGNKASDWSPSPADVDSDISSLDSKITTTNNKVAELNINLDGITQKVSSTESNVTTLKGQMTTANNNIATATELAQAMALGKMLNNDPIFKKGTNGIKAYNNAGGSHVTVTRIAKTSDLPTTSTHCMEIKVIGGTTSPGRGGFHFETRSRANAVFITRFIAKIPVGYSLSWHTNAIGDGSTHKWLTSTAGTGKWTEYICKVTCGASGSFSSTNYFALNGGSTPSTSAPLVWYLAYATVFDITDMDYTVQDNIAQITTTNNKVAELTTSLDGITQKVSSTESNVTTLKGQMTTANNNITSVNNKIDNLQIGGRNLVKRTDMASLWSVYATNRGRVSLTDNGQLLTWTSTGQSAIKSPFTQQLENGAKYTLTFKARGTLPKLEVYVLSNPTPNLKLKEWNNALSDTEFREFTVPIVYNHGNPCTELFIGGIANLAEQWLEIEKKTVKFESGIKATDWTPAPEDIESDIGTKANASDVYTKSEVYTKTETNGQISATANAITSRVSSLESKEVANRKVAAFRYVRDWLKGSTANGGNHWVELQVWANGSNIAQGKTVTTNGTVDSTRPINRFTDGDTSSSQYAEVTNDGSWKYLQVDLGEIHYNIDYLRVWHYYNDLRRYNHKLEVSVDGSTWYTIYNSDISGAYMETADGRVHIINETSTEKRLKTAESKITDSAIINTVSSTIQSAKNEAINSANSSTDNKLQNYATTSSLTQTADSITAKFTSGGGQNLLKNSDAKNGQYMWSGNGLTLTIGTSGGSPFFGGNEFRSTFPNGLRYDEAIKLKDNTDYVYEGWIYCDISFKGTGATPLHYWCMNEPHTPGQSQLEVLDYRQDITGGVFNKCYVHFRTKSGDVYFTPFVYGGPDGRKVSVRQLSLTEGKVETAWTPHPSEIYEGSTVIDASGVTVNNGALRVKDGNGNLMLEGNASGTLYLRKQLNVGTKATISATDGIAILDNCLKIHDNLSKSAFTAELNSSQIIMRNNTLTAAGGPLYEGTIDVMDNLKGLTLTSIDYGGIGNITMEGKLQLPYRTTATNITMSGQTTIGAPSTIELSGNNGHIRCNTIAIKSNGACDNILPGDDAYIGDVNVAHSIGIQSTSDRRLGKIYLGNRMDVFVGCDSPGGRLTLSSRWMDFLAPDGANFMGNIICRDGYEAGVTGFESYRDGGHIRIAPANHVGAIAFEQFNSSGSAVGMRLIADGWYLRPNGNDGGILGYSSIRWQEVWCTRGAFNGSDSKLKENITPLGVGVARPHSNDIVTLDDLYNYVKEAKTYTFNYKKTNETMLGILADEIPRNIFNKIGVMSKTQEEYEEELKKKEELTEILSKTPMPLDDKGEENRCAIVEGTGLTYAELKEEVNKEVEEPMQLINAPSQVAMLQTVLSMAINKVDTLEQENQELKDRLDKLENLVQSIVNK